MKMAPGRFDPVVRYLYRIAARPADQLTDRAFLDRYVDEHDQEAFAALVERHGGLVQGVCQRVVQDRHAAEDCFQAVFLVLATRAHVLPRHESLGPWLHAVAIKIALKANAKERTRRLREEAAARSILDCPQDTLEWRDLRPVLDDAVARLPSKYRVPFVLCYLNGRTILEIARELGQPKGTVASRLARARAQLRARLVRKGISLSAAALVTVLAESETTASVPRALVCRTIQAAQLMAAGQAGAALLPKQALHFMEGSLRMMMITNIRLATGILLAAALGVLAFGYHAWTAAQSGEKTNSSGQTSAAAAATKPDARDEGRLPPKTEASGQGKLHNISLLALRRSPIDVYRLGPGDMLGLVVDTVLGDSQHIPVRQGETPDAASSLGYPVPVREDGTISMPQVPPIQVEGLSIAQVERTLREAYTVTNKVVQTAQYSAIVTLARRRTARVLVIRQDYHGGLAADNSSSGGRAASSGPRRGTGQLLELPIGENDLITALAKTGGLPGPDAVDDVVIERTRPVPTADASDRTAQKSSLAKPAVKYVKQTIRIPMRLPVNAAVPFTEDDITLQNGDVVFVAARDDSK